MAQKFKDRISDIIDGKIDGEKGYKPNDVILAYIKQFFYTEESIEKTCAEYYSKFNKKPIEFIEYWKGDDNVHLETLKPDGYYESIYFSKEEISIAEKLFEKLKKLYNREATPLEKYQASF